MLKRLISNYLFSPDPRAILYLTRDPHWSSFSKAFIKKQGSMCAACGRRTKLVAHHIIPIHINRDLELDESNLIVLCENYGSCHIVHGHLQDYSSWNPSVREDAALYLSKVKARP